MSDKENKAEDKLTQEAAELEAKVQEAAGEEPVAVEEPVAEEKTAEEEKESPKTPEPAATGNEKVAVLKHDIYRKGDDDAAESISIELVIKNTSDATIGSVLFETELYDIDGKVLDKVEQKTTDLKPGASRTVHINYSDAKSDKVRSYCAKVTNIALMPESKAAGNDRIKIIKHGLSSGSADLAGILAGIDFAIKNVSDVAFSSIIFEAVFYDVEGNVLDTIRRNETELKPNASRAININCKPQHVKQVRSYDVKIVRLTTVEDEKIQLRRHEMLSSATGEKEVKGVIKNVSNVKADTAIVATFLNSGKENIATKVAILRDIEPNSIRQFSLTFKPAEGDAVSSHTVSVGDLVE